MKNKFLYVTYITILYVIFFTNNALSQQRSEAVSPPFRLKMESKEELLRKLQEDNKKFQELWQQELEMRRAALTTAQGISDVIQIEAKPTVALVKSLDGGQDMDLNVNFTYGAKERGTGVRFNVSSRTDDFPPGAYSPTQSNACRLMLEFAKNKIETELMQYLTPGARVTIKITGETDGSPIRNRLPYNGEFGDITNRTIFLNDALTNVSITQASGITSNSQLAFLRTQGVEEFLRTYITPLHETQNTYQIFAVENKDIGDEFRRISIDFIIHGAFNEEMNQAMNVQPQTVENFVPDINTNVPVTNKRNEQTYALIIANENYSNPWVSNTPFSINDGKSFAEYCEKTLGIPKANIRYLQDGTLAQIQSAIAWTTAKLRAEEGDGSAIVYYSGHGIPRVETRDAFIIPADGDPTMFDYLVSLNSMYKNLGEAPAKSILVVLDACFSGAQPNGEMLLEGTRSVRIQPRNDLLTGNLVVMSATNGMQVAQPIREQRHGLFTYHLLKMLQESKGDIAFGEWFDKTRRAVSRESVDRLGEQTPMARNAPALDDTWKNIKFFN